MAVVGVVAHFEALPGTDAEIRQFFADGLQIVEQQPASTRWFAFRVGPTTYGAFATFASEEDRAALLAAGGPRSVVTNARLFAEPPKFELVDMIDERCP